MSFINASYQLAKGSVQVMGHDTANLLQGAAKAKIVAGAGTPLEAFVAKLGEARGQYAELMAAGAKGAKDPEMARHFTGVQNSLREALDIGVPPGVLKVRVNTTIGEARKAAETVATQLEKTPAGYTFNHTADFEDTVRVVRNGLDEGWSAIGSAKAQGHLSSGAAARPVASTATTPAELLEHEVWPTWMTRSTSGASELPGAWMEETIADMTGLVT